jgi:uncharacterized protein YbcC (UPF0753/DUF2309 family)
MTDTVSTFQIIHFVVTALIAGWAAWLQWRSVQVGNEHQDSQKVSEEFINLKLKVVVLEERMSNLIELTKDINHKIERIEEEL